MEDLGDLLKDAVGGNLDPLEKGKELLFGVTGGNRNDSAVPNSGSDSEDDANDVDATDSDADDSDDSDDA